MYNLLSLYNTNSRVREFVRYCIVGVLATIIDMAIFYSMKLIVHYNIALISGYCLSLIFNYFMTVYWTFSTKSSARNLIGVVSAHMINLFVVRMGLMWLFVNLVGLESGIAFLPTIVVSVFVNFFVLRAFVK
ncbi:MAG: GtrA family protein [Bacteroidales bacterium]|nr:GtrA family protein [Bacteroidales bacterium]